MKTFNPDDPIEFYLKDDINMPQVYALDRVPEKEKIKKEDLSLPSKAKMASSLLRSLKNVGKDVMQGKQVLANSAIAEKRITICNECPKFIQGQGRCSLCGCYLKAKAKIASEACPIGKW